eukprot:7182363-Pyramimonas_sp.AAC.1
MMADFGDASKLHVAISLQASAKHAATCSLMALLAPAMLCGKSSTQMRLLRFAWADAIRYIMQ